MKTFLKGLVSKSNFVKYNISFNRKIIKFTVFILAFGGINRSVLFNNKPKIIRYSYLVYCTIFPMLYTYFFLVTSHFSSINPQYLINSILFSSVVVFDWTFACIKGTKRLSIVYTNLYFLEKSLTTKIKEYKWWKLVVMGVFLLSQYFMINEMYSNLNNHDLVITVKTGLVIAYIFYYNLDSIWYFYVFNTIRTTLAALYKQMKSNYVCDRKKYGSSNSSVEFDSTHIVQEHLVYYKKLVKAQEVMVWIMNPAYIFTVIMTLVRTGNDIFYALLEMKRQKVTDITLKVIYSFVNGRQKELLFLLLVCYEGDMISRIDWKIKTLLINMLVDKKDSLTESRVIEKFIRYAERKQDKLTTFRVIKITMELPLLCFLNLIKFFVLAVQFLDIM